MTTEVKNYSWQVAALGRIAERITEKLPTEGHSHTRRLQAEIIRLRDGLQAIGELHANRNPTHTVDAHTKQVATAAKKFGTSIGLMSDRLHSVMREGLTELDGRINAKVRLVPDAYAAEIRDAYRRMDGTERANLLADLVKTNNGPALAAITRAPSILTGILPEHQERFNSAIISTHAPEEQTEKLALLEAFNAALACEPIARQTVANYSDPAKLAEIEKAEQAANAAAAKLESFSN